MGGLTAFRIVHVVVFCCNGHEEVVECNEVRGCDATQSTRLDDFFCLLPI